MNFAKHLLEKHCPLSQSQLWRISKTHYRRKGLSSWKTIPNIISNTSYLAEHMSYLLATYLRAQLAAQQLNTQQPVYILEPGAGLGRFAYYCLQHFHQHYAAEFAELRVIYLMTDLSSKTVQQWREMPYFQDYLRKQQVQFLQFDCEQQDLTAQLASLEQTANPLLVIANYFFDSLRCDFFQQRGNLALEIYCSTLRSSKRYAKKLSDLSIKGQYQIYENCHQYSEQHQQVLDSVRTAMRGTFSFPIGGLQFLDAVKTASNDNFLIFINDTWQKTEHYHDKEPESLVSHYDTIFFPINEQVLQQHCQQQGMTLRCLSTASTNFDTYLLCSSNNRFFAQQLEAHYLAIPHVLQAHAFANAVFNPRVQKASLKTVENLLSEADYNGHAFLTMAPLMRRLWQQQDIYGKKRLRQLYEKIKGKEYLTAIDKQQILAFAHMEYVLQQPQQAMTYLQKLEQPQRKGLMYSKLLLQSTFQAHGLQASLHQLPSFIGELLQSGYSKLKTTVNTISNVLVMALAGFIFCYLLYLQSTAH